MFSKIVWCTLFGIIVLILGSCMKPVDVIPFLDAEEVQYIIGDIEDGEEEYDDYNDTW